MTTYSAAHHRAQQEISDDVDTVNINDDCEELSEDQIVTSGSKAVAFMKHLRSRYPLVTQRRSIMLTIIRDWLDHVYDEHIAVDWLVIYGFMKPLHGDHYELMSRIARHEFGAVALPERRTAPIPSVSRSDPFQPVSQGKGV